MFHSLRAMFAPTVVCLLVVTAAHTLGQPRNRIVDPVEQKEQLLESLKGMGDSESLRWNAEQIRDFSRLDGDDVIPALLALYRRPPRAFADNVPYLVADYIARRYQPSRNRQAAFRMSASDVEALQGFLQREGRREQHIWPVYCFAYALASQGNTEIDQELVKTIEDQRSPALIRAATLEGLARGGSSLTREVVNGLLEQTYRNNVNDSIMFEAVCWAVAHSYRPLHKPRQPVGKDWKPAFDKIIAAIEDERTLAPRTRRVATYALQHAFHTRRPFQHAIMWRTVVDSGVDPDADSGNTVTSFMGLEILGDRLVFVLDLSDSMLVPLNNDEKEELKGPVTQDSGNKRNNEEYEIDWRRVTNRFDAAREHVKWTLSRLPAGKQVAVILFGDDVKTLPAKDRFVPATARNVRNIHTALDEIKPGQSPYSGRGAPGNDPRPWGVLMGETNYYQALLAAYRMGTRGLSDQPDEHWNQRLLSDGADEIFFLSDGTPNRDGFSGNTPEHLSIRSHNSQRPGPGRWVDLPPRPAIPARTAIVRDPETGVEREVHYPAQPALPARRVWHEFVPRFDDNGPYAPRRDMALRPAQMFADFEMANLLFEIERMNLVRRCRLHCIGIGEARSDWLRPIANRGHGEMIFFGREQGENGGSGRGDQARPSPGRDQPPSRDR